MGYRLPINLCCTKMNHRGNLTYWTTDLTTLNTEYKAELPGLAWIWVLKGACHHVDFLTLRDEFKIN